MKRIAIGVGVEVLTFALGIRIQSVPDWLVVIFAIAGVALIAWGAWDDARRLAGVVLRARFSFSLDHVVVEPLDGDDFA
ncbi:MAG: hypothetical protein V3R95_06165, partial [Dehalococcoidia bacterium]